VEKSIFLDFKARWFFIVSAPLNVVSLQGTRAAGT
jgi:hypothetical protein